MNIIKFLKDISITKYNIDFIMRSFMINFCRTRLDNRQNQLSSFTVRNTNELFKQGENPQKKVFFSKWRLETTKQKNQKI